jgi:hypothetical protein
VKRSIYIGFDTREAAAFAVAYHSANRRTTQPFPIRGLVLDQLREAGLYWRPTTGVRADGGPLQLFDDISQAPMSTEFAISRFLTPILAKEGWALFMDCDVLVRADLSRLFELADPRYAVMCVQHQHRPDLEARPTKMDGQQQTAYPRKNWSSVMLFNCEHPAVRALSVNHVNAAAGRDLHRFEWLDDSEIGALPEEWNWLAGHSAPALDPKIVHFTDGWPGLPGYEEAPFAGEWRRELADWAGC